MYTVGKAVVSDKFVAIFGKKYGFFSPNILWRYLFLLKSVFDYFKPIFFFIAMTTKLEATKKTFFAASLRAQHDISV